MVCVVTLYSFARSAAWAPFALFIRISSTWASVSFTFPYCLRRRGSGFWAIFITGLTHSVQTLNLPAHLCLVVFKHLPHHLSISLLSHIYNCIRIWWTLGELHPCLSDANGAYSCCTKSPKLRGAVGWFLSVVDYFIFSSGT